MAVPRPAKGFTSARAEKWVLASSLLLALVYAVRHLVEGETSPPPSTSAARAFLGSGAPPTVGQWIIAYGSLFLFLSLLAVAAPEVAASLAALAVAGTFLESGGQLATDLQLLEHNAAGGPTASQVQNQALSSAQATHNQLYPKVFAGTAPTGGPVKPPATGPQSSGGGTEVWAFTTPITRNPFKH